MAKKKRTNDDKMLDEIVDSLNEEFEITEENERLSKIKGWVSTGNTILDMIITNDIENNDGAIPAGRITSIVGDSQTGKSLLAYMILADCQKKGGVAVLIDTEHAAPDWDKMRQIGVNPPKSAGGTGAFISLSANSIEEVFSKIETIIKKIRETDKDRLVTIVWDSIAVTPTIFEVEREYDDPQKMGEQARAMSAYLKKLITPIASHKIALVFLNQTRVDLRANPMFGQNETYPGGKAAPFYSSLILRLSNAGQIKAGTDVIGNSIKVTVKKNRLSHHRRNATFNVYFSHGVIDEDNWPEYIVKNGIGTKSGRSILVTFDGNEYKMPNRGIDFVKYIQKEPELKKYLKEELRKSFYIESDPFQRDEEFEVDLDESTDF